MDAKQELMGRIAVLFGGKKKRVRQQQIMEIVAEYAVQHKQEERPADLQAQILRFLSAKRIDGLSEKTLHNYKIYLLRFAKHADKNSDTITTDDVRDYLAVLKVAKSSMQTIINTLRSFFAWMTMEEYIVKNPMLKIKTRYARKVMRKALSVEELEYLRMACQNTRERALLEFFFSTGCRLSEVSGIRLSDVDFSQRSVVVHGKGDKYRTVYFSVKAKLLLDEYLRNRKGDMLFINTRAPYGPIHTRSIQKMLKQLGERASILKSVHPHLLRHTFATHAINNGMDITVIQRLLGHAHLSTTEIYAQVNQTNIKLAYDRLVA